MHELFEYLKQFDPMLFGVLGFLCGALVGHRLALGLEKRREYNEIVAPMRRNLADAINHPLNDIRIAPGDLDGLSFYLWPWQRKRLHTRLRLWQETYQQQRQQGPDFRLLLVDEDAVRARVRRILAALPPR